jgi:hypothetical protein
MCVSVKGSGLEITRIASQFAIQYMPVAMQLRFCIAVGCDAKTAIVLFIYLFILIQVVSTVSLNTVNALCHYPIVYRPRSDPAACGLFEALHGGLMRSSVESESWASAGFQRKKIKLRCNIRQMRRNLNFVSQRCDAILMNHFKP